MIDRPEHEEADPRVTREHWYSAPTMEPGTMIEVKPEPVDPEIGYTTSSPGEAGSW